MGNDIKNRITFHVTVECGKQTPLKVRTQSATDKCMMIGEEKVSARYMDHFISRTLKKQIESELGPTD